MKFKPVFYLQNFPEPIIHDSHSELPPGGPASERLKNEAVNVEDDDLTIAWRYKNLSLTVSFVECFDLAFLFRSVDHFDLDFLFRLVDHFDLDFLF